MMEKKITNKKVRYRLHNNGNTDFLNAKWRLTFLGRWMRMPCKNISARFWSSRSTDYIVRYSMIIDIRKIIPKKNENRFFNSWVYITNDEIIWSILINNMIEKHSNHDFLLNLLQIVLLLPQKNYHLLPLKSPLTPPRIFNMFQNPFLQFKD